MRCQYHKFNRTDIEMKILYPICLKLQISSFKEINRGLNMVNCVFSSGKAKLKQILKYTEMLEMYCQNKDYKAKCK